MAKQISLRFKKARHKDSSIDGIDIYFYYDIVTRTKEGRKKPVEKVDSYVIRILISGSLALNWGFQIWRPSEEYNDLIDLLFPYAVESIKDRYHSGNLNKLEEIFLQNRPLHPEYESNEYGSISDFEEILEDYETVETNTQNKNRLLIPGKIVALRDNINTLTYSIAKKRLLEIDQESSINELYKIINSKEEFWYGLASLANLIGKINKHCILELMKDSTKEVGSIKQLEVYLKTLSNDTDDIILPLKCINHVRQGFPIHTDKVDNYITTLKYFNLDYPITDYKESWEIILMCYSNALQKLFDLLKTHLT